MLESDTSYWRQGPTQKRKAEQESTRIQSAIAITLFFGFSNGPSIVADLQLVEGEQGTRRRAEVAPAGRAAEPRRPIGPRAGPASRAATVRAHRRPLALRPADHAEQRPGL